MQLLIDANNILHRMYHALQATDDGSHTFAVIGFVNALLSLIEDKAHKPDAMHLCFDTWPVGSNLRLQIYNAYKAERDRDAEVYLQVNKARQLCERAGLSVYYQQGYEADDLLATLARQIDDDLIVVSNDGDLMQLATNRIGVTRIAKSFAMRQVFYRGDVYGFYGLWPEQIVDFKALRGDVSDNVPGVDGIGEVWAANLIRRNGHLWDLYEALDDKGEVEGVTLEGKVKKSKAICAKLLAGRKDALMSYQLCSLMEAPLTVQSGAFSAERIHQAMREMGIAR